MYYLPPITDDLEGLDPSAVPPARRALPRTTAVVNGNNGVTQNVAAGESQQPFTLEQAMMEIQRQRDAARKRYTEGRDKPVDLSELQDYAKTRAREGQGATLAALAADFAGPRFAGVQEALLKRSMAAADPMKVGKGFMTADGRMIIDPYAKQEQAAQDMRDEVEFLERQYTTLATAADKSQERRDAREDRQAKDERDRRDRLERENRERAYRLQRDREMDALRRQMSGFDDPIPGGNVAAPDGKQLPAGFHESRPPMKLTEAQAKARGLRTSLKWRRCLAKDTSPLIVIYMRLGLRWRVLQLALGRLSHRAARQRKKAFAS